MQAGYGICAVSENYAVPWANTPHGIDAVLKNNELEKTSESLYLDGPWDGLTS